MVGIVIVSHSEELARGLKNMALQMSAEGDLRVEDAGGADDGSIGTSFEKIERAVSNAYGEDGVLVLTDLGSAVMTAEMVLETLPEERRSRILLCDAPLVEGTLAAASVAAAGGGLEEVRHAARRSMSPAPSGGAPEEAAGEERSLDVTIPNPLGFHARPAVKVVKTAQRFHSSITVQNLSDQKPPVDAKTLMALSFGAAAAKGAKLRITATGDDAEQALRALEDLVRSGFGEMDARPPAAATLEEAAPRETGHDPAMHGLRGIGVSEGYAVGPALVYAEEARMDAPLPRETGKSVDADHEIERLHAALESALKKTAGFQQRVAWRSDGDAAAIFEFHGMMLQDQDIIAATEHEIRVNKESADSAVERVFSRWQERASTSASLMRLRDADVRDVKNRVLRCLLADRGETAGRPAPSVSEPSIVVAEELSPAQIAEMDTQSILGIVTASGAAGSHAAILIRKLAIPAVMGVGRGISAIRDGTELAVDGERGLVEIAPSARKAASYRDRARTRAAFENAAVERATEPAVTTDGHRIAVLANVYDLDTADEAARSGADGVGLLRTEFLYLSRAEPPGEEEQYRAYARIAERFNGRPVIIRALDLGGDKDAPFLRGEPEPNPALGVRGARLLLRRPDLLEPQLRAILRSGARGAVKVMFPMIATVEEIRRLREALREAGRSLERDGLDYGKGMEFGIMVETPAAALKAREMARTVDFISIGSNDLTQYTLACDRENRLVADLYDTRDPAVLRLLRMTVEAAIIANKKVSICGEFAANREALPFLLGLGLDEISVAAPRIPSVKQWIRELNLAECKERAQELLES